MRDICAAQTDANYIPFHISHNSARLIKEDLLAITVITEINPLTNWGVVCFSDF